MNLSHCHHFRASMGESKTKRFSTFSIVDVCCTSPMVQSLPYTCTQPHHSGCVQPPLKVVFKNSPRTSVVHPMLMTPYKVESADHDYLIPARVIWLCACVRWWCTPQGSCKVCPRLQPSLSWQVLFVCLFVFFLSGFGFLVSAKAQAAFELHNLHWPGTVFTRGDYHYPNIPFGIVSKIIPQKLGIMHSNCA